MSILFFNNNKNDFVYLNVILLFIYLICSPCFAQINNNNLYTILSEKLKTANTYKAYIPQDILIETQQLLEQITDSPNYEYDEVMNIKINNHIDLLNIYIMNSKKKIEIKRIEHQIEIEKTKYNELEEINNELKLELDKIK